MAVGLDHAPAPPLADLLGPYATAYRPVFARADQYQRFVAYLHGLIAPGGRKNVEGLAAHADLPGLNAAQPLNHFVSHSPWDADHLLARYRTLLRPRLAPAGAVWAVHDVALPKRGRHSVGVQRQYARSLGQKVNCQLALVVSQVVPTFHPLAVRLYLPPAWLRDQANGRHGLPDGQEPATKAEIARLLLGQLRDEGLAPAAVVAGDGFADGLDGPAPDNWAEAAGHLAVAGRAFRAAAQRLGFDHFEGRTWQGWHHHAALVFLAHGFLSNLIGPPELTEWAAATPAAMVNAGCV